MHIIKEYDKVTLKNGEMQTIDLSNNLSQATNAVFYIMYGIGLCGTNITAGVPDVQKAPYGEGITLHGNNGYSVHIDIGSAPSGKFHIREFSNGGRGTNVPGMENRLTYKLVLTKE